MSVRTRIAPSPTGIAHVGTLYMALFNHAFAKQNNGQFLVRIEDTDRARFVEGAEQVIFDALTWAGITPDESPLHGGAHAPYRQSERLDIYKQYVDQLIASGNAYYCFATPDELKEMREQQQAAGLPPKYDGRYRDYPVEQALERVTNGETHVVRMRVPEGKSVWHDLIRGEVEIDHAQIDDQVILKSDGFPTYHLAVVVDDFLMGVTHVLRGEEWISSTPKHLLLYKMFGWEEPKYAHMPLLRNTDRSKLSKRKNDVSIVSYRDKGYLPEALLNFLMLLGWSHPEGKEFISLDEFIQDFTIDRMQKTGPIFDLDKLNWMNGKYLREHLTQEEVLQRLESWLPSDCSLDVARKILPLVLERLVTLADWEAYTAFFYRDIAISPDLLLKKSDAETVKDQLEKTSNALEAAQDFATTTIESILRSLQETHDWKKSQYFMMIRVAVTGQTATPPLFETMEALGKEVTLGRLKQAAQTV